MGSTRNPASLKRREVTGSLENTTSNLGVCETRCGTQRSWRCKSRTGMRKYLSAFILASSKARRIMVIRSPAVKGLCSVWLNWALPIAMISSGSLLRACFTHCTWPRWKGWNLPINSPRFLPESKPVHLHTGTHMDCLETLSP